MIHATRSPKTPLGDGNTEVVIEPGKVGSAARVAHRRFGGIRHRARSTPLGVHAALPVRIGNGAGNVAQHRAQRRGAAAAKANALRRDVLIEIRNSAAHESQRVVLYVLGRAHQPPLFGVPRGEHDRALGAMPRLDRVRDGACSFQHAHRAADVVRRARSPTIAMSTDHHHLIGELAATHNAERVENWLRAVRRAVVRHFDSCRDRSGAHVIPEGQPALPVLRHVSAAQSAEQFGGVAVRDWYDGDVRNRHLSRGEPWRAGDTRISRRGGITGTVEYAASLHAVLVAHRALRVHIAVHVAVLLRVAVDDQRRGAVLLRFACLDAAEGPPIARYGNPALH